MRWGSSTLGFEQAGTTNLRSEVMRIRANTRTNVLRAGAERRKMANATHQALLRNRASIRALVARGRREVAAKAARTPLLPPRSAFWTVAGESHAGPLWGIGASSPPAVRHGTTEEDVLHLIRSHPEGIGIVDLGNELGIDWRELAGPAERLLNHGDIEHIQQLFYPVAG